MTTPTTTPEAAPGCGRSDSRIEKNGRAVSTLQARGKIAPDPERRAADGSADDPLAGMSRETARRVVRRLADRYGHVTVRSRPAGGAWGKPVVVRVRPSPGRSAEAAAFSASASNCNGGPGEGHSWSDKKTTPNLQRGRNGKDGVR